MAGRIPAARPSGNAIMGRSARPVCGDDRDAAGLKHLHDQRLIPDDTLPDGTLATRLRDKVLHRQPAKVPGWTLTNSRAHSSLILNRSQTGSQFAKPLPLHAQPLAQSANARWPQFHPLRLCQRLTGFSCYLAFRNSVSLQRPHLARRCPGWGVPMPATLKPQAGHSVVQ